MVDPDLPHDPAWQAGVEPARPEEVKQYLLDEIYKTVGLRENSFWRRPFSLLFAPIVNRITGIAADFDGCVSRIGFKQAAQEWLKKWISGLHTMGSENLPAEGPLLIAANHPGMYDSLALASLVPRQDLRIVTSASPIFRALPNTRGYLIYVTRDTLGRAGTILNAIRHLRSGGALLIFPAGRLEPDPLHFKQAARQALESWSASLNLILRKVPQTRLVLAINSGFVAPDYLFSPVVRFRPTDETRQKLAEFIQVINQLILNRRISTRPNVVFGEPLMLSRLLDPADIQARIVETASRLLDVRAPGG